MIYHRRAQHIGTPAYLGALTGAMVLTELERKGQRGRARLRQGSRALRFARLLIVFPVLWTLYAVALTVCWLIAGKVSVALGLVCLIVFFGACLQQTFAYLRSAWTGA